MNDLSIKNQAPGDISLNSKEVKPYFNGLISDIEASVRRNSHLLQNFTVDDGWLGACLFYCYYAQYSGNENYYDQAEQYLDKALSLIDFKNYRKIYPTDSYDYNLASLGKFFTLSVKNGFLDMDVDAFLKNIDDTLISLCSNKIKHGDFNMFSGALAAGHYFYHRGTSEESFRNILKDIVKGIEDCAKQDSDGDYYWPSPTLKNNVYFGLTHGSAMIISFLAALHESGIEQDNCAQIIEKASRFILKHKRTHPKGLYPIILGDNEGPKQFTQCYGDLGVGYGLYRGAMILNDPQLQAESNLVLTNCMERRYEDGLTIDASLTYGAAGLTYIFEKLSRLEPTNPHFKAAYYYWIRQIPKYATHQNDYCGFKSLMNKSSAHFNISYRWGNIGIGISLMKYLKPDLPPQDGFNFAI